MIVDYRNYALFNYEQAKEDKKDLFILGSVVIDINSSEIGVIIQRHGEGEYRTDKFGNCWEGNLRLATIEEIKTYRPKLINSN